VQTKWHKRSDTNRPFQIDYVLATESVEVVSCAVDSSDVVREASDHFLVKTAVEWV
jgi:endonuclease/exonuclease/phosphatase family metal-dependent hydrolase